MAVTEGTSESSATPLDSLISHDPEPEESSSSSTPAKEAKDDEGDEASQKFPESSPDEKQADKGAKPEKQASDVKKDSEKTPDVKTDAKTEGEPTPEQKAAKEAEEAKKKWENDENPFFKRYRDTSASWQKEHQEKLQLQQAVTQMQQEMGVMRKIADGTYDPEVDDPAKHITPEAIASQALTVGKALSSKAAMIEQHGSEVVEQKLAQFHEHFGGNQMVQALVLNSDSPVHEAFRVMERLEFETKYGSSPADWHKNIRAEAEKELREKLKAEITEDLMGRADKKNNTPRGLSSPRGSNGLKAGNKVAGPKSLGDIFSR